MKMFISGSFWHGSLEESYARAFETIGWNVVRFNWDQRTRLNPMARIALTERLLRNQVADGVGRSFVDSIENTHPDFAFVIKGQNIARRTLEKAKQVLGDRMLVNFNPDSPWDSANRSRRFLESIPLYDVHFNWNRQLIKKFVAAGARRVEYLPFAHDPTLHHPIPQAQGRNILDAVFVGTYSVERDKILGSLADLNIRVVGNGWSRARWVPKQWIFSPALYGEDALNIVASGACAINILRPQNEGSHNMRTFEIPASARPMLTMRSEEQSEWFREGIEMECYGSKEELSQKIKLLRSDLEYCETLARNGYERVREETYEKRARQIVELLVLDGGDGR